VTDEKATRAVPLTRVVFRAQSSGQLMRYQTGPLQKLPTDRSRDGSADRRYGINFDIV